MSLANPSFPRRSYAASRRCAGRCFFMRPSRGTNQVLGYCLGYALQKFTTVRLTSFSFLSTHYHLVASDEEGDLAGFFRELNSLIARSMNCHLGRGENFWVTGGAPRSAIFDEEGLWEQLVYCTVNPTKDGLVSEPKAWPGLLSIPEDVESTTFRFERPTKFFRSEGTVAMPDFVEFELERPVEFEGMELELFREEYRRRLDQKIAEVHKARSSEGRGFMGPRLVRDQDPLAAAEDAFPDRDLNPRVVCKDVKRRRGVLRFLSEFRFAHAIAWFYWSRGQRDVVFPAYTYLMRVKHGVRCRGPGLFESAETELPTAA